MIYESRQTWLRSLKLSTNNLDLNMRSLRRYLFLQNFTSDPKCIGHFNHTLCLESYWSDLCYKKSYELSVFSRYKLNTKLQVSNSIFFKWSQQCPKFELTGIFQNQANLSKAQKYVYKGLKFT